MTVHGCGRQQQHQQPDNRKWDRKHVRCSLTCKRCSSHTRSHTYGTFDRPMFTRLHRNRDFLFAYFSLALSRRWSNKIRFDFSIVIPSLSLFLCLMQARPSTTDDAIHLKLKWKFYYANTKFTLPSIDNLYCASNQYPPSASSTLHTLTHAVGMLLNFHRHQLAIAKVNECIKSTSNKFMMRLGLRIIASTHTHTRSSTIQVFERNRLHNNSAEL